MALASRNHSTSAPDRVVITGIGSVTPLGETVWSTGLALRFRKSAWCEHETVLVADDPYGIVLRGATVSRVSEQVMPPELDGAERAVALLSPAVKQCIAGLSAAEIECLDCQLENFIDLNRHDFPSLVWKAIPQLVPQRGVKWAEPMAALGRCAFFERVIQAAEQICAGSTERALVGCVDSLCATSWLMAVRDEGVLKDSLTPEGIIAGEAAGALLLEREAAARRRNAPILAVVASWGRGTEPNGWEGPLPSTGKGLTDAFYAALSSLDDGGESIATVIADLNGQRSRALDWAYTEGRIFPYGGRERELRHPAFTAGDCGGATGALLVADAFSRFAFHPRFNGRIALSASDQGGARRVLCLERGDRFERRALMEQIRKQLEIEKGNA